jgi:hypothetical protein
MNDASSNRDDSPRRATRDAAGLVAVVTIIACVWIRATTTIESFPGWSSDPSVLYSPPTGITPLWSFVLDAVIVLASSLLLFRSPRDRGMHAAIPWLVPLGGLGVLLHAVNPATTSLEDASLGSAWLAAASTAAAGWAIRNSLSLRKLWLAGILSLVGVLALRAGSQVFIEHPRTLESFKLQRQDVLASLGWTEGSAMARAYERRLLQPEATGWFGLANIFGSLGSGLTLAFASILWFGRTRPHRRSSSGSSPDAPHCPASRWLLRVGLGCGIAILLLSGAKGSIAATIAVAALIALMLARPTSRPAARVIGTLAGLACIAGPLLAVIVRGQLGERIHELSLYFRWFYMQAATRIIAQHPLQGVGPASFKDAYLLSKNPLSPEDVTSPHSIFFDWLSTLGASSLAWCALIIFIAISAGRAIAASHADHTDTGENSGISDESNHGWSDAELFKISFLAISIPTIIAANLELALAAPEVVLLRIAGLALGVSLAWGVIKGLTIPSRHNGSHNDSYRLVTLGAGAGLLAILAHSQIELTAVSPGSALWLWALAGVVLGPTTGPTHSHTAAPHARPSLNAKLASIALLASLLAATLSWFPRVFAWESALRESSALFDPVQELRARVRQLDLKATTKDTPEAIAAELSVQTSQRVAPNRPDITKALTLLELQTKELASKGLNAAARALDQRHFPTMQALSRLSLQRAQALAIANDPAAIILQQQAVAIAGECAERAPTATSLGWAGIVNRTAAAMIEHTSNPPTTNPPTTIPLSTDDAARVNDLRRDAINLWTRAMQLAPLDLNYACQLADLASEIDDRPAAAKWAKRCLEIDELLRLDPLRRLNDDDRRRYERLSRQP